MVKNLGALCALLIVFSCAKSEFAADSERGKKNGSSNGLDQSRVDRDDNNLNGPGGPGGSESGGGDDKDGGLEGDDNGTDTDIGGDDSDSEGDIEFTDGDRVHKPMPCEAGNIKVIQVGDKCPRNMAMYTMDDMSKKSQVPGSYVCCSLPAGDILLRAKKDSYIERDRTCGSGEVMVGAVDTSGKIFCTKINSDKYKLDSNTKMVCAGKQGGAFGIGAQDCDGSKHFIDRDNLPSLIKQLVIGPLGADGCVSHPYGSLITRQGGRKCENSASMQLKHKSTDKAVKIFP